MMPLYFGSSKRRLFGTYHPASTGHPGSKGPKRIGVLICGPIGEEQIRAYSALRQLASSLSRDGYDAFRFDYHGVGDSSGDLRTASLDGWMEDIETAADELSDMADVSRIIVVGLRLGATLIANTPFDRLAVESMVFWDPVTHGASYLTALEQLHATRLSLFPRRPRQARPEELMGFYIPSPLQRSIETLTIDPSAIKVRAPVILVTSERRPEYDTLAAECRAMEDRWTTRLEIKREAGEWNLPDNGVQYNPVHTIRELCALLAKRSETAPQILANGGLSSPVG
jgi:pimeloyl-ACP methyl ester carboxylesterase